MRHFRRTRSLDNSDQRGGRRGDALIIVSFAMRDLNYHRSPMQPQRSRPPSLLAISGHPSCRSLYGGPLLCSANYCRMTFSARETLKSG